MDKTNTDVTEESSTQDVKEESSASQKDVKAGSLMEHLQQTIAKHEDSSASEEAETESTVDQVEEEETKKPVTADKPEGDEKPEDEPVEETEDEEEKDVEDKKVEKQTDDTKLPFAKHPRFKQLIDENKSFREEVQFGRQIQGYMNQRGINVDNLNQALQVVDLLVNDHVKAYEVLRPIMDELSKAVGEGALPKHLASRVEAGEMTETVAREIAKYEGKTKTTEARTSQQQQRATMEAYNSALNGWLADKMRVDPGYKPKTNGDADGLYELHEAKYGILCQQKRPTTPAEAVALAEQAYKEVKRSFERFTPVKRPIKVLRSRNSTTSATQSTKPKSIAEAIRMSYAKHRG